MLATAAKAHISGMPQSSRRRDRILFGIAGAACATFVALVLVGVPLVISSLVCAGMVAAAFLGSAAQRRVAGVQPRG
jgi:hypothetical protein